MKLLSKRKKNKYNKKYNILIALAGLIILGYILYAIINLIKSPTDVFIVEYGNVSLEESAIGYLIREETVIKGNNYQNGIVQIKTEGEKVSKGDYVFRYYNNNEEEITNQIKEIDNKINEALGKQTDIFYADIRSLDKQIEQKIETLSSSTETSKIREYKNDINTFLTKKSKIIGKKSSSGSYINQLYEERSLYEAKLTETTEYVTAPTSGIVSYRVDSYENVLTPSDFSKINKELLEGLNLKTGQIIATNDQEGKVINNFECYIATVMKSDSALNAQVGQKVKIRLSNKEEVEATIEYKSDVIDEEVVLVFKITSKVEDLISYRKISFDLIWWSDTGLRVPNSAIIYDEENNPYIIRNRSGYLDKILVKKLKETKSYTIIDNYKTEDLKEMGYSIEEIRKMKKVALYDEIISKPQKQMLQ